LAIIRHSEINGLPERLNYFIRPFHFLLLARAREVIAEGTPELIATVDRGAASASLGEQIAQLSKDEQRRIVASCDKKAMIAAYKMVRADGIERHRIARIEKIEAILRGNRPLDTSIRYPVILADPPWQYENPPMGSLVRQCRWMKFARCQLAILRGRRTGGHIFLMTRRAAVLA
jgi:hypothetical protein